MNNAQEWGANVPPYPSLFVLLMFTIMMISAPNFVLEISFLFSLETL